MPYDELVQRLREPCQYENCILCQQAADAIEELSAIREEQKAQIIAMVAEDKPRWIPVTERLPKYGDWVLGIGPKKGYHVCEYRGISHFVYGGDSPWFSAKGRSITVTHWMPLPTPPTAEEGNVDVE